VTGLATQLIIQHNTQINPANLKIFLMNFSPFL